MREEEGLSWGDGWCVVRVVVLISLEADLSCCYLLSPGSSRIYVLTQVLEVRKVLIYL